ncbi:unnamed protein product [Allacma fusca]|uniref:Uncharacterized protein n=1 Tax=Allacma fusca TaxID=39272 RepID=A0A8J2KVT3_9HEXA|nr:unnamed protein product [Allacma fusca]
MKIYAACAITHTILGAFTGGLFWYCFFYWLDKEVIVIPEDEVSNLIIIEPESEATIIISSSSSNISTSGYLSSRSRVHAGSYFNRDSRGSYLPGSRIGGSSRLTSGMRSTRDGSHLRHGSYIQHSPVRSHSQHHTEHHHHHSHPHKIHLSHTALLHEQEQALGGHVLAEMHVNHGSTKMLQAKGSNAGQHHATVALVRNRNPPPKNDLHLGKGQHGQTGNLAKDIVDMSGNSAKGYIEDVVIPPEVPGKKPHAIQIPIGASVHSRSPTPSHSRQDIQKNINATSIQDKLEDLIHVFSHDHEDKKKSHKSVVIERKDHHRHHQKHPKDHNVDHELSEPRLLPPIGSHESSLNDHHQHHHHEHGNPHHHGSHHRDHGSQFHHHVSQHHQDHHHSHHHQDHHLDHHHSRHQHSHHQHHGNVRGEHHHPHVDLNGSILGQNHVLSSSRHGPHHHGSRSGGNHRPDHERYLHAGHEHHHHDRYPQYGGYHGHGQYSPTNSRTHHHHPHGRRASSVNANRYSPYRGRSKDFRYGTTTVLFKNPKDLDDSD